MGKQKLKSNEIQSLQTFKDPSEVIAINTIKITEVQLKGWLAMLYAARSNFREETHELPVEEFKELSGYSKHDHKYLVDAMAAFCGTVLRFNTLGKSKKSYGGVVTSLLAGADFEKKPGWVIFSFSPMLKDIVENSKMFGSLSLALVRNLETKSGLALYRLMNDYRGIRTTPEIPLKTLREILGVDEKEYLEFKDFNKWVLKPACKQVEEKTDLKVIPHFIRVARKVAKIKFEIIEQKMPLLVKKKPLSNQKQDKKLQKDSGNPNGHLTNIEIYSELMRLKEREEKNEFSRELLSRRASLRELLKSRGMEAP